MPKNISPRKVQDAVQMGFDRLENFRSARMMYIRQYVGQYYDADKGEVGGEALNLIFNAIRVLVPHIVMNFPKHTVSSNFLNSREYGNMLSMALDYHGKTNNLKGVYRRAITDAIFTLGIVKTGLAESDSVYAFNEYDKIDTGTVYSEAVDFDNWVVDPNSREHMFEDAAYMGDRITVPRQKLLDSGLYRNDLIEQLPTAGSELNRDRASDLSMKNINKRELAAFQDDVEIVELWVPDAKSVITIPGSKNVTFDDYLRVDEYYGPDVGPYTLLALSPPVPGNPLPVPAVGVWYDLHVLANRMAKKTIDQAERQKDVGVYRRAAADDAEELRDAGDGDMIAVDDPTSVEIKSFGGQQQSNEIMTGQLQSWFNMMAANPQGVGGQSLDADSATEAKILAGNAGVGLEDMKDLVYDFAASESRKRAWYFHTDPFINAPLIRRDQIPAQYAATAQGPMMTQGPRVEERQVMLTPEARRGDWLDFTFEIEPESMGRVDASTRLQQAITFAVKILPAAMQAAQVSMMLGIPFDVKMFIINMARDAGIKWMDQVWHDPDFQMRMMQQQMMGPGAQGSQGQPGEGQQQGFAPSAMNALIQNGQPGNIAKAPAQGQQLFNQQAQAGANQGQSELRSPGGIMSQIAG